LNLSPFSFLEFGFKDIIETLIIAFALFTVYRWIRGSFAVPAFVGLIILFLVNILVNALGFTTINFMLSNLLDVGVLALIIIFQPEIRKLLYNLGQNTSIDRFFRSPQDDTVVDEVLDAVRTLSRTRTGALIVFAKNASLAEIIESGESIDSRVTSRLLVSIFLKDTPLHDGAVIIRNNRIVAASCYLPISQNQHISASLGTRHRAALGVSENNNVFVIVVSEENGRLSVASNGKISSGLTIQQLREEMLANLNETPLRKPEHVFADE
jgi:diadenylate cyclase